MKKHLSIFLLLLGIISFIGCSSETTKDIPEVPHQIIINESILTNGLSFTHEGGEQSINFSCNQDWKLTISNGNNWCTPSKTNGTTSSTSVSFIISKNESTEKRKATVTIQAGSVSKTFTIQQDGVPEIIIDNNLIENGISCTYEGEEITIDFKTNMDWQLSISDKEWCVPSQTSGEAGQASISLKISKNEKTEERETVVTIQAGSFKKTFTIKQDELVPEIIIDNNLIENGIHVNNQENSPQISFSVNTHWTITKGDQAWCIPSHNSGPAGDIDITFSIAANETYYDRKAQIAIETQGLKKVIYITQEKKNILSAITEHYSKKYTAGNILVNFRCNTDFNINIDVQWLKQIHLKSDNDFNHELLLAAEENTQESSRTAKITITNEEKGLKQIITIIQKDKPKDGGISPDGNIDNMEWE